MNEVTLKSENRTLRACLSCELDHHTAKPVRECIDRALFCEKPKLLILDFSGVRFMDSSGIGLILGRLSLCEELGCTVRVEGLSEPLLRVVRLSGIGKLPHLILAQNVG